jgi:transposase InsO family protein
MNTLEPPPRLRLRHRIARNVERLALRAALDTAHLFGLAAGQHLRDWRADEDPLAKAKAQVQDAELRARLAWQVVDLLAARLAKVPERQRPHYTPAQRFRILEIKNTLGWAATQTARTFLVCAHTIANWEHFADPLAATVGSTVKPVPPVRRAADVVRTTVQALERYGFGGSQRIAQVLAHAGWKVATRSVARYRRQRRAPEPTPSGPAPQRTTPVFARFVHHTWMLDVTLVRQFLGPDLYVLGIFDAYARAPLALQVFARVPRATDTARLFRQVATAFTVPKYVITDLGDEFRGHVFQDMVKLLGAHPRFASAENLYATAMLERFWRTLKDEACLRGPYAPLNITDLEQRVAPFLAHYLCLRPHGGLRGAMPAEVILGVTPACQAAVEAPRGRPGERGAAPLPVVIDHLDRESRRHPFLAAA